MNVLVLNGSPKGTFSITLQTVLYLEKRNPGDHFSILHVGRDIRRYENDFSEAAEEFRKADLILFAYPVYTFLVPSQLHRFIELLKEQKLDLAGKFASQISTSKHFYDVTAHAFIKENCFDLGLKYVQGLSADMEDLLKEKGQKEADMFYDYVSWSMEQNIFEQRKMNLKPPVHMPVAEGKATTITKDGRVVIVTDCGKDHPQLASMIDRFAGQLPYQTDVLDISEFPFQGGCLGCMRCAGDGTCIYKDGFSDYLRSRIQTADAIVTAFTIQDHSMGSLFKKYDDRQFCNGHRTVTIGIPFAYLVSGNISEEENLRMMLEARASTGGNFLTGIASDETDPDGEIDRLAEILSYAIENHYTVPQNFYGVGGIRIFRDLIWMMQGFMAEDHRFFKAHGMYDFPQKRMGTMIAMHFAGMAVRNKKIMARIGNKMNEGMVASYQKVVEKTKAK